MAHGKVKSFNMSELTPFLCLIPGAHAPQEVVLKYELLCNVLPFNEFFYNLNQSKKMEKHIRFWFNEEQ